MKYLASPGASCARTRTRATPCRQKESTFLGCGPFLSSIRTRLSLMMSTRSSLIMEYLIILLFILLYILPFILIFILLCINRLKLVDNLLSMKSIECLECIIFKWTSDICHWLLTTWPIWAQLEVLTEWA